jgi:hypothetical protein
MTRPEDEQPYEKALNDLTVAVKETYYGAQIIATWIVATLLFWWPLLVLFDNPHGTLAWILFAVSGFAARYPARWVGRSWQGH